MSASHKLPPDLQAIIDDAPKIPTGNARKPPPKPKPSWRDTAVTAIALRTKTFEPIKFILPGLITEGVNLLVSPPKLGKSWMILDICLAAAANRSTLGDIKPMQGDVLYLALEDSERRLQSRIDKLLSTFGAEWPERLTINTKWRRVDQGGIDDLKEWGDSVKEPVMIVIDVFAKVRPANSKSKQLYEADYEAVGLLQAFATERGIAVVLIHHDRKMEADDPFDTVSGSTGITGAADTILILKRTAAGVTLYARGRDIEEAELAVQFNRNICKWTILCQAVEVRRSDERSRVIAALKKADGPLSVKDLMAAADLGTRNAADVLLFKMTGEGEIVRVARGQYGLPGCSTTDGEDRKERKDRKDSGLKSFRPKSAERFTERLSDGERVENSTVFSNLSNLCDLSSPPTIGKIQPSVPPSNLCAPQTE
jgi:hypothetical protein